MRRLLVFLLVEVTPSLAWVSLTPMLSYTFRPSRRICLSTISDVNEIQIGCMNVPELKESLRARGLKVSGTKSELLERLSTYVHDINNHSNHNQLDSIDNDEITYSTELQQLPSIVRDDFIKYTAKDDKDDPIKPNLLPIQQKSYQHVADGGDTVLFSPTGSGKTLAYILPLAARLLEWKRDGSLAKRPTHKRRNLGNRNDSMASEQVEPSTPSILVMEPSRELARQVGKVWTRFHPTATKSSKKHVVTVYGGVPMARHASLLNSKTDVVIGTPGRIKELIRERYLSTANLKAIVLDEADSLLNFADVPEVEWLLEGMQNDYQLILASATINERVHKFVDEIMEISVGEEGYVVVNGKDRFSVETESTNSDRLNHKQEALSSPPDVRHWSMAASASSRVPLASDLILTIAPRRGIIFAPSKAEVEKVAQELSERLSADHSIHILHGDMVQAARSRTVAAFRGDQMTDSVSQQQQSSQMTRILVATDVASRGLDLPTVDLVLQFGVPRQSGKDGTYDSELYIHRTGRAGRFGNTRTADAILFYDSSAGERSTLTKLKEEMERMKDVDILPRTLPTPNEVMSASFNRATVRCQGFRNESTDELVEYFKDRLIKDGISPDASDSVLVDRLACAMAALSGLPQAVRARSLLTADQRDRTVRIWTESGDSLTPPEVTTVVKSMGSGKLGRINICADGSAIFDLSAKRAEKLLQTARDDEICQKSGWHFELPNTLPSM